MSYAEPWANPQAPLKLLKWMFRDDSPLLFRPQLDWRQWAWGLAFLRECLPSRLAPNIRAMVLEGLSELDGAFASCFRIAKEKGELAASADPAVLAQLASATIHTIAIRARARVPRRNLEAIVTNAIDLMCGPART